MKENPQALRLIGWYPCGRHGFAMPLYGTQEGANALSIALSEVRGDHASIITSFMPIGFDQHRRLPEGESIEVVTGEPWRDVFIWNDAAYVGTPSDLWNELSPLRADVEARAPLSLLELAIHARRPEAMEIAGTATDFLKRMFDESRARRWRIQFLRAQAELTLRRALRGKGVPDDFFTAIDVRTLDDDVLGLAIPDEVRSVLGQDRLNTASSELVELADALGARLKLADVLDARAAAAVHHEEALPPNEEDSGAAPATGEPEILVVADGTKAREIVRYLSAARKDELPFASAPRTILTVADSWPTSEIIAPPQLVLLILGQESGRRVPVSDATQAALRQYVNAGALVILVPALSRNRPSQLFSPDKHLDELPAHAVLDTAIARSPFWGGNPKRSFERRISDVMQLAMIAAGSPVFRRELMKTRVEEPLPVLSVGLVSEDSRSRIVEPVTLHLGSEASWVAGDPKRSDPAIHFSLRINPEDSQGVPSGTQLVVEARRRQNSFPEFASAILASDLTRYSQSWDERLRVVEQREVPTEMLRELREPSLAAAFVLPSAAGGARILVCAETPRLGLAERAAELGWHVVRYTDAATLRRLIEGREPHRGFPDEIEMEPIRSSSVHRHLASRGIDQRDVVRVKQDVVAEWLDGLAPEERAEVRGRARPLRSASRPTAAGLGDLAFLRDYVFSAASSAARLRSIIGEDAKTVRRQPMKRALDLQTCWTPPSDGLTRYAIVDGAVPPVVFEMEPGEVPLQDLFVIDGDHAVPALFRSRAFGVWARATLPAASSWMARFSVASTFGGFPIPDMFRIVAQEGSAAALVADTRGDELAELIRRVDHQIERELAILPPVKWKEAHRAASEGEAMRQIDGLILAGYGLLPDAPDILILTRLQELNAKFDAD